ncbi:MAG: leucine-rich repeat domain-containing protein [Eubacterium sp.]|nr:leucine-rich repeat domain-containing protein [Eubacterium sp.]
MKKSIFTFLRLLFGVCLTLTIKQTADAKGYIRYYLSEDGVLSFYGKGELKRADYLLSIEKDCIKKIVIGEGITSLGKNSLTYFPNAKKVILPSSLKKIGDNVFSYMSSMKTIKVPNLVISIGKGAFSDCDLLKKLVLPDSVTSIGKGAFSDCDSLKKLVLPASLKSWKKVIAQN